MTPEGTVKRDIQRWLHAHGFLRMGTKKVGWPNPIQGCYHMPVSNGMGIHGMPDFRCTYRGRTMDIEAKAPGCEADTSQNQKNRHEEIRLAGGVVFVADSVASLDRQFEAWSAQEFPCS